LLTKPDGTKFGKTAGDAVWLDKDRTSPYEFYQYWINLGDEEALDRVKQFTSLSKEEIQVIETKMQESPHLRHAQKAIAEELTTMIHGEQALIQVKNITKALFKGDVTSLSKEEIEMGFKGIASIETRETIPVVDAMMDLSLASSKREARTLIKQNAIAINGEKITDQDAMITDDFKLYNTYTIIKRGKKHYGVIKHI
jgi:tyrosyl-tRNA synthetase